MRRSYLDVTRLVACFLVIVNHTNSRLFLSCGPSGLWFSSLAYFFLSKIAVPLFLLVSGELLLGRCDGYRKTAGRFFRILGALALFSLLYYIRDCLLSGERFDLAAFFLTIGKTQITNAFWYLYLYLALMLMLPPMQRMASGFEKRDYLYFMGLSLVVLGSVPYLKHFFPALDGLKGLYLPLFSVYLGLLVAGRYFGSVCSVSGRTALAAGAILVLCLALNVLGTWREYLTDSAQYLFFDDRTGILITVPAVCAFLLLRYLFTRASLSERASKTLGYLSGLTFGAYLLSDMAIGFTEGAFESLSLRIGPFPAVILWELAVFAACMLVTALLKQIPFLKKLI